MDLDVSNALMRNRLAKEVGGALDRVIKDAVAWRWGKHDCVLWAADILMAAGLPDPVPHIRGKYRSAKGAHRVMGKGGLEARTEEAAAQLGWREMKHVVVNGVPTYADAAPGDIGLIPVLILELMRPVMCCVIRGPHGDWHGPTVGCGYTCSPDYLVVRAWSILP